MADMNLLDGEIRYYPKVQGAGSGLEITNVRIKAKGGIYSTNYLIHITHHDGEARKRWEIVFAIGFVLFILFFIRSAAHGQMNLLALTLGILCLLFAIMLYRTNVQTFFVDIKMTNGEDLSLSFKSREQRDEVFEALSKALAFWRIHQTPIEETKTRMERFHVE